MQQLTDGARRTEQHHSTSLHNPTDQNELTVKEKEIRHLIFRLLCRAQQSSKLGSYRMTVTCGNRQVSGIVLQLQISSESGSAE